MGSTRQFSYVIDMEVERDDFTPEDNLLVPKLLEVFATSPEVAYSWPYTWRVRVRSVDTGSVIGDWGIRLPTSRNLTIASSPPERLMM